MNSSISGMTNFGSTITNITGKFVLERGLEGFFLLLFLAILSAFGIGSTLSGFPSDGMGWVRILISALALGFGAYYIIRKVNL